MLLVFIFLFLRFYKITDGLYFFNDMGRDMLVLQQWKNTSIPPLLGPQTSALPFNQSAVYFYLLFPGFLISQGNPISLVFTMAVIYLLTFIYCLYLCSKNKILNYYILTVFFLISIHPQYIIQNRFVWNPTFVTPFVIIAILNFYLLLQKFTKSRLFSFAISISLAISFSYSVAPLLIMFAIYWLLFNRKHLSPIALALFGSLALTNLPTLFFELRHHFFLTQALLSKHPSTKIAPSFFEQSQNLSQNIVSTSNRDINQIVFFSTIFLCCYLIFRYKSKRNSLTFISSFSLLGITLIAFLSRIPIESHFIFAFTSLIFIIIASLPKKLSLVIVLATTFLYLRSSYFSSYFKPARQPYSEMQRCLSQYCSNFNDPTFVSVQSNLYPYHIGYEYRYLMAKNGCKVKSIETQNGQANFMTVILDQGTFNPQTHYYELDLFGKYQEISRHQCKNNLELVRLKKQN